MVLQDKVLLMNSTQFIISNDRLKDILVLQLKAFLPFLVIAFFISKLIAKRALRPFLLLKDQFLIADRQAENIREFNQHIRETDIKQIANGLATALEQKEQVLEQQISFNKGISHELRTPLQVMTHAAELIALKNPHITQQAVYQRLTNSITRMHRMSEALLWLTTAVQSHHQTQVNHSLLKLKKDMLHSYSEHALTIEIIDNSTLNLPLPEAVFEFIVFSLTNNTVHHGNKQNGEITLHIEISETTLIFKNRVEQNQPLSQRGHFGIGLSLIDKLCNRFGIKNQVRTDHNQFIVMLTKGA